MEPLVYGTSFSHLSCVTSRKKRKFGIGEMRAYDIEQRQVCVSMKLESSLKWLSGLQFTVASKVNKSVVMEAIDDRVGCCGF